MRAHETSGSDPQWDQSLGEELANSISHALGLLVALIGAPLLLLAAWRGGDRFFFTGAAIFAAAMLLVYLASTLYHAWPRGTIKSVFQMIDHYAIFLLIAGTYTPFTLGPLRGAWGWTMLALVWALAVFGLILKKHRRHATRQGAFAGPLFRHGLARPDRLSPPGAYCAGD